jgi:glycine cleavage system H lipoate-binding protein
MDADKSYSMIPDGELRCIWMEAGVVNYKLCDRNLDCDSCPFNVEVRQNRENALTSAGRPRPATHQHADGTATSETVFADAVTEMLGQVSDEQVPGDRLYHRSHFWLKRMDNSVCRIGIDHVAAGLLRPVLSLVRSTVPTVLQMHEPCCWLVVSKGTISVPSPVDGMLQSFNPALFEHPSLLDTDPYGEGWMMEVVVRSKGRGLQDFELSSEQPELQRKQTNGIRKTFLDSYRRRQPSVGATMYDGGTEVPDVEVMLGARNYFDVVNRIFRIPLEP